MFKKLGIGLATIGSIGAAVTSTYLLFIGPLQRRWRATDEEVLHATPCDDEVERPLIGATRAITINARPEEIWPVQ
jgi:hypothetical protein